MMVWTIAQLERTVADGGVTIAHWRASQMLKEIQSLRARIAILEGA